MSWLVAAHVGGVPMEEFAFALPALLLSAPAFYAAAARLRERLGRRAVRVVRDRAVDEREAEVPGC